MNTFGSKVSEFGTKVLQALVFTLILFGMLLLLVPSGHAYAAVYRIAISTYSGSAEEGTVGFSHDEMGSSIVMEFDAKGETTLFAEPSEGYEFYAWLNPVIGHDSYSGFVKRWIYEAECTVPVYANDEWIALFKSKGGSQHYVVVQYMKAPLPQHIGCFLPILVENGEKYVLPEYTWVNKNGCQFAGWQWLSPGSADKYEYGQPGDVITVSGDIILKPQWVPLGEPCRIEFKCTAAAYKDHGIMSQMDSVIVEEGTTYELPKSHYVLTGWEFTGWYVVRPEDARVEGSIPGQWFFPDSEVLQPGDTIVVDSSLELWCQWEMVPHDHELEAVECNFYYPCEDKGFETYWMCTVCGKIFSDADGNEEIAVPVEVPPLGHDLDEWVVTKEPTTTEEGEQRRVCKRDGCTYFELQVIDALTEEDNGAQQGSDVVESGAQGDEGGTEGTQGDAGDGEGSGEGTQGAEGDASSSEGNSGSGDEASQGTEDNTQDSGEGSQGTGSSSQGVNPTSQGSSSGNHGSSGNAQGQSGRPQSSSKTTQNAVDNTPEETLAPEEIVWDEPVQDAAPVTTARTAIGSYAPVSSEFVSWTPGDDEGLNIVIEREAEKEDTFAHFVGVVVDGTRVAGTNYTATEGSLDLTLKPEFLETLASGEHVLRVVFDDGSVEMSFRVEEGAVVATTVAESVAAIPWKLIIFGFAALVVAAILVIFVRLRMLKMADSGMHTNVRR